jgi:hypothetical protein
VTFPKLSVILRPLYRKHSLCNNYTGARDAQPQASREIELLSYQQVRREEERNNAGKARCKMQVIRTQVIVLKYNKRTSQEEAVTEQRKQSR